MVWIARCRHKLLEIQYLRPAAGGAEEQAEHTVIYLVDGWTLARHDADAEAAVIAAEAAPAAAEAAKAAKEAAEATLKQAHTVNRSLATPLNTLEH